MCLHFCATHVRVGAQHFQRNCMCAQSSLSAWRRFGSLAIHTVYSEDSDQTAWMGRMICVFGGHTCYLVGNVMNRLIYFNSEYAWGGGGGGGGRWEGGISRRHIEVCIFSYFSKKIIFSISNKGDNLHEMPNTWLFLAFQANFLERRQFTLNAKGFLFFLFFFFLKIRRKHHLIVVC